MGDGVYAASATDQVSEDVREYERGGMRKRSILDFPQRMIKIVH